MVVSEKSSHPNSSKSWNPGDCLCHHSCIVPLSRWCWSSWPFFCQFFRRWGAPWLAFSSGWLLIQFIHPHPRQSAKRGEDHAWKAGSFSTSVTRRSFSQGSHGSVHKSAAVGTSVSLLGDNASRSLGKKDQSETSNVKWFFHFVRRVEKKRSKSCWFP